MQVQPYLFFEGRCEEALAFYREALGAEITFLLRFDDAPDRDAHVGLPPGSGAKVQHASVRIGETTLFASDGRCSGSASFHGVTLSLAVASEAEAERRFAALSAGGQVLMPLASTFFSPRFGMVTDRFGVSWMVLTEA
mgnify:CR=1 FL=1